MTFGARVAAPGAEAPAPIDAEEEGDEALPQQRLPIRIMSLVWLLLAVVASFWRVCTGDSP